MAKQVLQLGMGDAFDDWLIEKIQILRRGSVVASGIRRVEQVSFLHFCLTGFHFVLPCLLKLYKYITCLSAIEFTMPSKNFG